jgi:recombination DNA repair RAD52 pathway protein
MSSWGFEGWAGEVAERVEVDVVEGVEERRRMVRNL